MPPANLVTQLGQSIRLGKELGKGGEGSFFEVEGTADVGVKLYHASVSPPSDKLRAMLALQRNELYNIAAWPKATLHIERPGNAIVGFLMQRVRDHKEIHSLYSPAHRKKDFPQADWKFLLIAAMNCAAAMENLHQCGVVMGDVNQSNLLVAETGHVIVIDCDSFQIQSSGKTFFCEVGVDLFTPPELQGRNFRGVTRTPNHDRFGLAVMIFQLLFLGRHPFMGRFLGKGDLQIDRAISEFRYAYGLSSASYQMQPPPLSLSMTALPPLVVGLFERAFGPNSAQPNARPSGIEWFNALKTLLQSLRTCQTDPGHVYSAHLYSCPWCELMRQNAPNFFISVAFARPSAGPVGPVFILSVVWSKIEKISPPALIYNRPAVQTAGRPAPLPNGIPAILPAKPTPSPVLTSPPQPPAIVVPRPTRVPVTILADPVQRTVTVVAILFGVLFIPLLFLLKPVGIAAFIAFVLFGGWWIVLEVRRLHATTLANKEYEDEVAELKKAARRKLQEWKDKLAAIQDQASKQYEEQLRPWRKIMAVDRGLGVSHSRGEKWATSPVAQRSRWWHQGTRGEALSKGSAWGKGATGCDSR